MTDIIKYIFSSFVLIAGIVGYYYFPEQSGLLRTIGVIVAVVVSTIIAGQTERGRLIFGFVDAAKQEVRKIIWPTKKEANQTTLIVVVVVLILGVILWMVDSLLSSSLQWLIG